MTAYFPDCGILTKNVCASPASKMSLTEIFCLASLKPSDTMFERKQFSRVASAFRLKMKSVDAKIKGLPKMERMSENKGWTK